MEINTELSFTVFGKPAPKGSVRAVLPKGAKFPVVLHDNKKTKPWCEAVRAAAYEAYCYEGSPRLLTQEAIEVSIACYFSRPKSHFGTGKNAAVLKREAPSEHTKKPDSDKLARSILDGLTGIVYHDDAQVTQLSVSKHYTEYQERAVVSIRWRNDGEEIQI